MKFNDFCFCIVTLILAGCSGFRSADGPAPSGPPPAILQISAPIDAIMASTAYRIDTSTINLGVSNPSGVNQRIQPLLADEATGSAAFKQNSRLVPDPVFDTDGRYKTDGTPIAYGYLATVKGRPISICGLTGAVPTREADCASRNGTTATWEGRKYGQSGEGDWKLVALISAAGGNAGDTCAGGAGSGCFEVWQDQRTQLIWSDAMTAGNGYGRWTKGYNWFQASGFSTTASSKNIAGFEAKPGAGTDCDNMTPCQPNVPISACANASLIAGSNGISKYQNPDGTNGAPDETSAIGKMTAAVYHWRLPTREDFELADVDGIRKVLPNMDQTFWTASSDTMFNSLAWSYNGTFAAVGEDLRTMSRVVRCVGSGPGVSASSGLAGPMASLAYRTDVSTINLASYNPSVGNRYQPLLSDELLENSVFSRNSRLVPDPSFDNDGFYKAGGGSTLKLGYLETVKGRPTAVCGLAGTTAERVADCVKQNGSKAIWQGAGYGQSGEGDWKLVTRVCPSATPCFEVWQDQRTQLIWSDASLGAPTAGGEKGYNWFQASGYSSSASTKDFTGEEAQAGAGYDCEGPCQPAVPISVCTDAAALAGQNGVPAYQNADESGAKGLMSGHQWRLPTKEDWELADIDGIRKVLPNMNSVFWSSSSNSLYNWGVWTFNGATGANLGLGRFSIHSVRCVGR